jgi:hypothetical protein
MTEGMLGGILGEEAEKPEVEAPEALAGAEAFAAAVDWKELKEAREAMAIRTARQL